MITPTDFVYIFLLGSIGGFLSGFLGVGGGIVFVPILQFFLTKLGLTDDELVKAILANSLFTIIFSGLISSFKQYQLGNFYPKEILYTALPGAITAVVTTFLIKAGSWYSNEIFNLFFAFMLLVIALRMFTAKAKPIAPQTTTKGKLGYHVTGFFAGFVTALSGLGGGVVMTPVFTDVLKVDIKKASSISNGVIPVFAIAIGILNLSTPMRHQVSGYQVGYIILPVVAPLIASALAFAPLGVKLTQKASPKLVRLVFGFFVSAVFIKTVYHIFYG